MSDALDAITLVVATQRSGSTLLCRDIESLGGMGAPREFFLEILRDKARVKTEEDVLAMIAKGQTEDTPGVGSVKLMVGYASKVEAMLSGKEPVSTQKALDNIVSWAKTRFTKVNLVVLIRTNSLDQAISRSVAKMTDVWHNKTDEAEKDPYKGQSLSQRELNLAILNNLQTTIRQKAVIRRFAKRHRDISLSVIYEDMAKDVEASSAALISHAKSNGLTPQNDVAVRELRKLIDEDRTKAIKADLKKFLDKELGLWD